MSRASTAIARATIFAALLTACNNDHLLSTSSADSSVPPPALTLAVTPLADSVATAADSFSTIRISATTNAGRNPFASPVFLSTDLGTFVSTGTSTISIPVSATDSVATATLRAPRTVGLSYIHGASGSALAVTAINFVRAYPDTIFLKLARTTVTLGDTITVIATLRRDSGFVTPGTRISFSAVGSKGQPVGAVESLGVSDSTEQISVFYSTADTTGYTGLITITVSTLSGSTITAMTKAVLTVNAPATTGDSSASASALRGLSAMSPRRRRD
jgi:hypothetical protein